MSQITWRLFNSIRDADASLVYLIAMYLSIGALFYVLVGVVVYPPDPPGDEETPMLSTRHARQLHRLGTGVVAIAFIWVLALYGYWLYFGPRHTWNMFDSEVLLILTGLQFVAALWQLASSCRLKEEAQRRWRLSWFSASLLLLALAGHYYYRLGTLYTY